MILVLPKNSFELCNSSSFILPLDLQPNIFCVRWLDNDPNWYSVQKFLTPLATESLASNQCEGFVGSWYYGDWRRGIHQHLLSAILSLFSQFAGETWLWLVGRPRDVFWLGFLSYKSGNIRYFDVFCCKILTGVHYSCTIEVTVFDVLLFLFRCLKRIPPFFLLSWWTMLVLPHSYHWYAFCEV